VGGNPSAFLALKAWRTDRGQSACSIKQTIVSKQRELVFRISSKSDRVRQEIGLGRVELLHPSEGVNERQRIDR
jgi:hypothetical protein